MELGHLLTRSGLTYPEVSSKVLETCQWLKISPEWVTGPEQGKSSSRTATFSLWTGMSVGVNDVINNRVCKNEYNALSILNSK